jgi:hypothetical protein
MSIPVMRISVGLAGLVFVGAAFAMLRAGNGKEDKIVKAIPSPAKLGQVYRALRDVEVMGNVSYKGPVSSGFKCILPGGERIVITNNPPPGAQGVWASPLSYKKLERQLVPEDKLNSPAYGDYGISVAFFQLAKFFELEPNTPIIFDDPGAQEQWELIKKHNPE